MTDTFESWLEQLQTITAEKTGTNAKINQAEAKKWYSDGFTPYQCFRENWHSDGEL